MINKGIAFPEFSESPYGAQLLACNATFGPRIEMFKRGFIGEGWEYDINSAYPDKIANLPDLRDGEWKSGLREIDPSPTRLFQDKGEYSGMEVYGSFSL